MPNTKIHPSNIDMDLLSKELVQNHDFNQGQKNDVSHVADIEAGLIAKAATRSVDGKETLVNDRDTVEKALFVFDPETNKTISADNIVDKNRFGSMTVDYMDKTSIVTHKKTSEDIMSLREELYALFNSLSKKGILNNYYAQNGFFDPFNKFDPRCSIEDVCDIAQVGAITAGFTQHIYLSLEDAKKIQPFMWYIVEKHFDTNNQNLYAIVCVTNGKYNTENELVDFTVLDYNYSDVGLNLKDKDDLYTELPTMKLKSLHGQYINNTYSFSKTDTYVGTGKVNEISFDDDSLTVNVPAIDNGNNPAFAFSFRVPANKIGVLKTLSIYGNTDGNASDLRCYVLKDSDRADELLTSLDERYVANDTLILGRSKQVFLSALRESETWNVNNKITFDFADEADGKYKLSLENDTYLIVIVKTNPEATGTWNLLCSRNPSTNNDVQTYNKLYTYHRNVDGKYVFTEKEYRYDLIYSIITEEVLNEKEIGFNNGLYTSQKFDFDVCNDLELTMVINREGLFRVATSATINGSNNDPIVTELDTSVKSLNTTTLGYNYGIKAGDILVIGDKIVTVKKENSDNRLFINEDNIKVNAGDKIYKVGYKPHLMLYLNYTVSHSANNYEEKNEKTPISIPLELVKVIPNNEKTIDTMSDKLVFKINSKHWPDSDKQYIKQLSDDYNTIINAEIVSSSGTNTTYKRLPVYKAQLSVAWESTVPEQYFSEGEYSNSNFIGRIYNLVVSSSSVLGSEIYFVAKQ